jgi:molecular chaperone GrpE
MPKTTKPTKPTVAHESVTQETEENFKDKWLRALADYKNLERRVEENQSQLIMLANASLLSKLLPTLDLMETALKHVEDQGFIMIVKQFQEALKSEQVHEIEALEHSFDSATMECVETKPGEKDQVIEVLKKGYRYKEFVLRPAQVIVGNGVS